MARRHIRRGFTLAELIMGLLVTCLVGSAVAAVSISVAQGWSQSDPAEQHHVAQSRSMQVIESILRSSRQTGVTHRGSLTDSSSTPAEVMLWRTDKNGDGAVQTDEVVLLRYEPAARQIVLYEVSYTAPGQAETYNVTWSQSWWTDSDGPDTFVTLPVLVRRVLASDVAGAELNVLNADSTTQLPCVDLLAAFQPAGEPVSRCYAAAALRSVAQPHWN